jgi:threonine dehydratase
MVVPPATCILPFRVAIDLDRSTVGSQFAGHDDMWVIVATGVILIEEQPTLADSPGGGIGLDNTYTFAMTRDLVDELVLVREA